MTSADSLAPAPTTPRERWEAAAAKALRGASLESLVTVTLDGVRVEPLYTRDPDVVDDIEVPGRGTHRRGGTATSTLSGWEVRQTHDVRRADVAASIRSDLERGVTAAELSHVLGVEALDRALDGVHLDMVPVRLTAGSTRAAADALMTLWRQRGHGDEVVTGTLGLDPIATLARTGGLNAPLERAVSEAAQFAAGVSGSKPGVVTFDIGGSVYGDAGAADAQEVAAALATGVTYLRAMTAAGLDIDAAARQIHFSLSVGPDQFEGIAKIRAARQCWARIVEASGGSGIARAMYVHAVTSAAMMTAHDPWVNMLRCTSACFAAAAGGADAITVSPFDAALGEPSELGLRVARNTQSILTEESMIGAVVDPAGGSWYVESLTTELATAAWSNFQAIERHGGMAQALRAGLIHDAIANTVEERRSRVAHRRDAIVGVSEFPSLDAPKLDRAPTPPEEAPGTAEVCQPLTPRRWSEPFDRLRAAAAAEPARPTVFLANLGVPSEHSARAGFAQNLLAAGGVEAITNNGFATTDECVSAFGQSATVVAVICSSDRVYADRAAATAAALKAAGCPWVVLAGAPGESEDALRASGVDAFIFAACDVVEALTAVHAALGVGS